MTFSKPLSVRSLTVSRDEKSGEVVRQLKTAQPDELKSGSVRVQVEYSSLNFKDALCATGHPGVARTLPLVPGIDAAGTVLLDNTGQFTVGQAVMVFHPAFGTKVDGGYRNLVDVPAEWVYPIPEPLTTRMAMIVGTAGFTAAQSIEELQKHNVTSDAGPVVVSGATGGVGACSVLMLSQLGYEVTAVTGKADRVQWLRGLGAAHVVGREEMDDRTDRPLLTGAWAGAIDTVGGNILATILRSTVPGGCVTACGLTAGADLELSVYPFILRGITLQGIDTAGISRNRRAALWNHIARTCDLGPLEKIAIEIDLEGLETSIQEMLNGRIAGRVVVKL